jgi:hypothetical protein
LLLLVLPLAVALALAPWALAQDDPTGEPQTGQPPVTGGAPGGAKAEEAQPARGGAPEVVRVGVLINDIQQLDLQSHSYNVDMYMWFKWDDPEINPANSFEFMNAFELWGHILTYETQEPKQLADGTWYQVLRNQGKFNAKLPLQRYPFDTQHLLVEMEHTSADTSRVVYEPDDDPISLSEGITIPGWEIGEPTLRVVDNQYDTDFGDPSVANPTYSRVVIDFPVTRPEGTYALKLLLPMLLVALTALLSLMLHPRWVEGRIGIGITALLTLVALQLTSNSSLPEVNYLLLLDKLYILSYGFVVLTLAVIVRNSWVDAEGDVATAARADRIGIVSLTILYFAVAAFLLVEQLA